MRWRHLSIRSATSLVEVVVAMVITVIVMGMLAMAVQAMTRGPAQLADRAKVRQQVNDVLQQMTHDLQNATSVNQILCTDGSSTTPPSLPQWRIDLNTAANAPGTLPPPIKYEWPGGPLRYSSFDSGYTNNRITLLDQCQLEVHHEVDVVFPSPPLTTTKYFAGENWNSSHSVWSYPGQTAYLDSVHLKLTAPYGDSGAQYVAVATIRCVQRPRLYIYN